MIIAEIHAPKLEGNIQLATVVIIAGIDTAIESSRLFIVTKNVAVRAMITLITPILNTKRIEIQARTADAIEDKNATIELQRAAIPNIAGNGISHYLVHRR